MKRSLVSLIMCPLLVIALVVSGCGGLDPDPVANTVHVAQCLGAITVEIAALVGGDPLALTDVVSVGSVCISDAVAIFDAPTDTSPASPVVTIHTAPNDSVTTLTVDSNTVPNCTTQTAAIRFKFAIPFVMSVGDTADLSTYSSAPTGSSNNDLIAQQLFQQYGTTISKSIPPLFIVQKVPPNTQMQLHVTIELSYKDGLAQVVSNGSVTQLPWSFTDGYKQTGSPTFTGSTASACN